MKTEILEEDLLIEGDRLQPSILIYGAVSLHDVTELQFVEGTLKATRNVRFSIKIED